MKGKLIVIEGTDGSGKKTQTDLLEKRLKKEGYSVASFSFPQYGQKSAGMIEEYLNGVYGPAGKIDPYISSLFFALDRFALSAKIRKELVQGKIVITDRYVDSNAGHQGSKIQSPGKRGKYLEWLYDLEYRILKIPKPDLVIILHIPAALGQKLVAKKLQRKYLRGKTHDQLEADLEHLRRAEACYLWLSKKFPKEHKIIECTQTGEIFPIDKIHELIWNNLPKLKKGD